MTRFSATRVKLYVFATVFFIMSAFAGQAMAADGLSVTVAPATTLRSSDTVQGTLPKAQAIRVVVGLKLRNKGKLDAFVADIQKAPRSKPKAFLSQAQMQADYLPTKDQVTGVVGFLSKAGFTDIKVAPNHVLISATGSTAIVESAFRTHMVAVLTASGRHAYANSSKVRIPASLRGIVLSVQGLQTVYRAHTMARAVTGLRTHRSASTLAITGHNPVDFPAIYGSNSSVPTGAGINVGIITSGDLASTLSDLDTFTSNNSLASVTTHVINVNGTTSDTSGDGEWAMDSQSIVGMAGGEVGTLIFYNAKDLFNSSLSLAYNRVVSDDQTKIINVSLGLCETSLASATIAQQDQIFQSAVAQGQTFSVSSGDSGSDECGNDSNAPSWPASSQFVVALGGTRLDTSGTTYNSETTWSGTGGSPSSFEPMPSWQQGVGQNTGHATRGVPDVAYDADPNSGARVIVHGGTQQIGGTSLSAPLFAGLWARVLAANSGSTGFAAPMIYGLPSSDFHDITSGNNGGFSAAAGWDYTTGFGSPIVASFVGDLSAPHPPTVALKFAPNAIAPEGSATLTITLNNATLPTAATLTAPFTDNLPAGVLVATTPNASTTCTGGAGLTAAAGSSSISLASGAVIPASGVCTISADVTAAGTGTYTNTVAAGALQTDLGDNADPVLAVLTVGNGRNEPLISVAPGSLNFTLATNATDSKPLTVNNVGGGTLAYSIDEANANAAAIPQGAYNFQVDDGTSEGADGLTDANQTKEYESVWLNRFSVSGPVTLNAITIYWPAQDADKTLVGKQPNLVAYYDADGDGDPSNAIRLGGDNLVSIAQDDALQTYPVSIDVPGAGDLYVGFADAWAAGGTAPVLLPAAADSDNPQGQSLLIYNGDGSTPDLDDLSQNGATQALGYNLMIRASGTNHYDSSQCSSPQTVAWLSESPTNGAVLGGHDSSVGVTADASGLTDGEYSALLCVSSNDAARSMVQVPVNLTVGGGGGNQPPVANFVYSAAGLALGFTDTSSDSDGTITAWAWDFGDGNSATSQNPSHTYASASIYTVQLTVTDNDAATNSYSRSVTVTAGTPVAEVTPTALSYALRTGESGVRTLTIGNTGTADLSFSFAQAAPQQVTLGIDAKRRHTSGSVHMQAVSASLASVPAWSPLTQAAAEPSHASSDMTFSLDSGSYKDSLSFGNGRTENSAIYLNRYTPAAGTGPFTINTISVLWPTLQTGSVLGKQARMLAYYDADGDGDPANAVLLGQSTVTVARLDAFETYHVSFDVPGAGDVYVGFEDQRAEAGYTPRLYPAAIDKSASQGHSYLFGMRDGTAPDFTHLANNTVGGTLDSLDAAGDLLIRATGTLSGGPTADCNNPNSVPWLTENPVSGTVSPAGTVVVTVGFDATGMAAGQYTALLCIGTNDPHQSVIEVPVAMQVSACVQPGGDDVIFADGFDGDSACVAGDVVTGTINQPVAENANGDALNLVTGAYHPFNASATDDDINLYLNAGKMYVYWYSDLTTLSVGGVVDGNGEFKVMHSGDLVGPAQTFSGANVPMTNWLPGAGGYVGIAFRNEDTGQLNYGYIHLTTTSANGFPAQILEYAFDRTGAPIPVP